MNPEIEVAAGSVVGRDHRRVGKNNQDALGLGICPREWWRWCAMAVAVSPTVKWGRNWGPSSVQRTVTRQLEQRSPSRMPSFGRWCSGRLIRLRSLARQLGHDLATTVQQHLLFTLLGAIVTPQDTVMFGLGDGVYALNGEITQVLGPYAHNAPPYLAYHLLPATELGFAPPPLQVHCQQSHRRRWIRCCWAVMACWI
jgi:hypothetical protein